MKITLEPTSQFVTLNGAQARVWQGETDKGVPLQALIAQVAVHKDHDNSAFEAELREVTPKPDVRVFSPRMVL